MTAHVEPHLDDQGICHCPCQECDFGGCVCEDCQCDPQEPGAPAHLGDAESMAGWNAAGDRVELTEPQAQAVRTLLEWGPEREVRLAGWGHGAGKTVVYCTVAEYERAQAAGHPLPGDPRWLR